MTATRMQRSISVRAGMRVWQQESPSFRAGRMCAPSMGAILEVKVLSRADHSERSETQLREGNRTWGGSV